jgi:hypothetical protein
VFIGESICSCMSVCICIRKRKCKPYLLLSIVMIGRAPASKKDFVDFLYLDISSNSRGHTLVVWFMFKTKRIEL